MKNIGFIGVGTMGFPMALNLIKNGHSLSFYDPFANNKTIEALIEAGAKQEKTAEDNSCTRFGIIYGIPEALEVCQTLPGDCGFIFPQYQPMPIHGNPIHPQ